jgi:hypothetical protein
MCFEDGDNDYKINFIRKINTSGNNFRKPENEGRASVHEKQTKYYFQSYNIRAE